MAQPFQKHIGISVGRVKRLSEGLGEFAFQLGSRLAAKAPELAEVHQIQLHFHMRRHLHGIFGDKVKYRHCSRLHRLWNPSLTHFSLWHSLHQLNTTRPADQPDTCVLTVHDLNFLYVDDKRAVEQKKEKLLGILAHADSLVGISNYALLDVQKHLGWTGPSRVIYNGSSDLRLLPQEPIDDLVDRKFFFHLSRMAPNKNVESIVDLARIWPEKLFVFAGAAGEDAKRIAAIVQRLGLRNVEFQLDINDGRKAWLYANCEAFMFPSLAEGFGLPPIEAMYFGKPVFVSDRTCLPEICGDAAYYWHSFEPELMRRIVESGLTEHSFNQREIKVVAHAETYNWDRCADQYLQLYLSRLGIKPEQHG
ncbi:MAG: glycosyltransferase family 4 protein [Burkholderiaceae bacterium]